MARLTGASETNEGRESSCARIDTWMHSAHTCKLRARARRRRRRRRRRTRTRRNGRRTAEKGKRVWVVLRGI